MSFFASNNRIRVTDGSETVFDTNEDMPHIIGTAYVSNVSVAFSNIPATTVYWFTDYCGAQQYVPDYCVPTPDYCTPNPPYEMCFPAYCSPNPPDCYTPYCPPAYCPPAFCPPAYCGPYDYFCFPPYCPPPYCPPPYCPPPICISTPPYCPPDICYSSPNPPFCRYNPPYCTSNPPECVAVNVYSPQYSAREFSSDTNIVDLPTDEDGNAVSIDFVVIQASGSRTAAGVDARVESSFLSTVPAGTFSFQGSMLLESSSRDDGSSWFRRIISVFVNNNTKKLVLRRQETVGTRRTEGKSVGSEASTFNFNFKIFFGRFKS